MKIEILWGKEEVRNILRGTVYNRFAAVGRLQLRSVQSARYMSLIARPPATAQ